MLSNLFLSIFPMLQPHLLLNAGDVSPYVLLPGDPGRVDVIGNYLENFCIVSSNREFRVGFGVYKGRRVTVCSTGIGCPSTAIAVEELIAAGARFLVRVGTCGGAWRADVPIGTVVIPTACVRDEATTSEYIPPGFPAVADLDVLCALSQVAQRQKVSAFVGINRTHDAFYGSQDAITKWGRYLLEERWKPSDTPILSSDMETAALYVIASLRNVKAGCVLAVNASPEPLKDRLTGSTQKVVTESSQDETQAVLDRTIRLALEALLLL